MNSGKCPKCEKVLTSVIIEKMNISVNLQPKWLGVSYVCPHCRTILSVGIDPIALKTDLVQALRSS
jgi:uncharacterized protein with PIN domain